MLQELSGWARVRYVLINFRGYLVNEARRGGAAYDTRDPNAATSGQRRA